MTTRGSNKASGSHKPTPKRRGSRRGRDTTGFGAFLRPEHQRDLFALGLITIALVTIIFFATGDTGGAGSVYVTVVRQIFGGGAVVVPVVLGFLGLAILIQEYFHDSRLSGANVSGTLLIITAILNLLEFPVHLLPLDERGNQGGGVVGKWMVQNLDSAIGRPAAVLVVLIAGLAGVLLTFNLTLRELFGGLIARMVAFWALLWDAPRPTRMPRGRSRAALADADLPFSLPPQEAEDAIVETPIAARPTRASLFQRPGEPPPAALPPPRNATLPRPATPAPTAKP
ncbi:MAG: DNA translocase FtsK 4TM domain-containing protein, partial [Chloroflexales bacterium]